MAVVLLSTAFKGQKPAAGAARRAGLPACSPARVSLTLRDAAGRSSLLRPVCWAPGLWLQKMRHERQRLNPCCCAAGGGAGAASDSQGPGAAGRSGRAPPAPTYLRPAAGAIDQGLLPSQAVVHNVRCKQALAALPAPAACVAMRPADVRVRPAAVDVCIAPAWSQRSAGTTSNRVC